MPPRNLPIKSTQPLNRLRKVMNQAMKASVDEAAFSMVSSELDITALTAARATWDNGSERPSLNTFLMAAIARTLPKHPLLNAELADQQIVVYEPINLGMAIAVPDGLIVAVIPNADQKSVSELHAAITDLVSRARANKLGYPDIEGCTFAVSNLGMYGIDVALPIPRPHESAILVVGRGHAVPAVVDGAVAIRDKAWFSLTFDHRFIDGAAAASFLADLQKTLEADLR